MSLFLLQGGKARPATRESIVEHLEGDGASFYDVATTTWLCLDGNMHRPWVVVDVVQSWSVIGTEEEDKAFTAKTLASYFMHMRPGEWKNSCALTGSDHLPFYTPVHHDPYAWVLSRADLNAVITGEYRAR